MLTNTDGFPLFGRALKPMVADQQPAGPNYEEGDVCPVEGCTGNLAYAEPENCSCHISPPCAACTDAPLECPECGWTAGED